MTTIGLRNLAGRVNGNGTVTLWAVTSTNSTVAGPTYGTVYRGVADVSSPGNGK